MVEAGGHRGERHPPWRNRRLKSATNEQMVFTMKAETAKQDLKG
jgi:hypothetical protein